jgi:hypothetical protein
MNQCQPEGMSIRRAVMLLLCIGLFACDPSARRMEKARKLNREILAVIDRDERLCNKDFFLQGGHGQIKVQGLVDSQAAMEALVEDIRSVPGVVSVDTSMVRINPGPCTSPFNMGGGTDTRKERQEQLDRMMEDAAKRRQQPR